jgi:GT2 family glycosyltransferase
MTTQSQKPPLLTVIILNWNGKKVLSECLAAIQQQVFKDFLTIVVDNGSDDGSVAWVKDNYPEVEVIGLSENLGFSAANNIALKKVHTRYAALLNNDAFPHPLWTSCITEALETHPEAGFAASKILFADQPSVIDRAGDSYTVSGSGLLRGRGISALEYNCPEWVFGACAAAAVYRTRIFQDTGFLDEDFFLLYEDVDLSFRCQLKGYKCLYVPDAVVCHKASRTIGRDSAVSVYYGHRNSEWVYIQNMPLKLLLLTIIPHFFYDLAAFFYFAAIGRGRTYLKAKRDALKGLKKALSKRRIIQKEKRVKDAYVWGLLESEPLFLRIVRKLRGAIQSSCSPLN